MTRPVYWFERDPVRFAQAIVGLLADPQRLACLGRQGREYVLRSGSCTVNAYTE